MKLKIFSLIILFGSSLAAHATPNQETRAFFQQYATDWQKNLPMKIGQLAEIKKIDFKDDVLYFDSALQAGRQVRVIDETIRQHLSDSLEQMYLHSICLVPEPPVLPVATVYRFADSHGKIIFQKRFEPQLCQEKAIKSANPNVMILPSVKMSDSLQLDGGEYDKLKNTMQHRYTFNHDYPQPNEVQRAKLHDRLRGFSMMLYCSHDGLLGGGLASMHLRYQDKSGQLLANIDLTAVDCRADDKQSKK